MLITTTAKTATTVTITTVVTAYISAITAHTRTQMHAHTFTHKRIHAQTPRTHRWPIGLVFFIVLTFGNACNIVRNCGLRQNKTKRHREIADSF